MKTMVQSFLVEETKELIYDSEKLDEWKAKCKELGLKNQLELASEEKSPMPFPFMNTVMKRVYETICPAKVDYKSYKKTTIPLEVLSLIALSEQEKYFDSIMIWYDDKSPDPLAIGVIKNKQYSYIEDFYLIARWGDELKAFETLKNIAIKVYANTQELTLKDKMAECKHKLENLENNVARYFDAQIESYHVTPF